MFTPADRPAMMRKAPSAGADTVVFDLEDAVAPGRKAEARAAVGELLSDSEFDPESEVCVRVTPVGTADDDCAGMLSAASDSEAVQASLDSVMLPKAGDEDDVESLRLTLREHDLDVPILALVETAQGVLNAPEIAAATGTDAVLFGAEDLSADLGATRTDEGTEVLYAREHVVLGASAAGVDAVDTVYTDTADEAGLREETRFAAGLGYDGKMAIHPAQIDPINEAFTPDDADVEWARKVLAARDEAADDDRGVFAVDGEMIDAPLIARAERIVERAAAAEE